jgi:hypothetical protein
LRPRTPICGSGIFVRAERTMGARAGRGFPGRLTAMAASISFDDLVMTFEGLRGRRVEIAVGAKTPDDRTGVIIDARVKQLVTPQQHRAMAREMGVAHLLDEDRPAEGAENATLDLVSWNATGEVVDVGSMSVSKHDLRDARWDGRTLRLDAVGMSAQIFVMD